MTNQPTNSIDRNMSDMWICMQALHERLQKVEQVLTETQERQVQVLKQLNFALSGLNELRELNQPDNYDQAQDEADWWQNGDSPPWDRSE